MTDDEIRAALQPFLEQAQAGVEDQVEDSWPQTDLQEVVERAHRQDPDAVPEAFVEATRDSALLPTEQEWVAIQESPQLSVFMSDVAEHIESWVEARRLEPVPALVLPPSGADSEPEADSGSGARPLVVAVGLLAAAAVLLLTFATDVTGLRADEGAPPTEAVMSSAPTGEAVERAKQKRPRVEARTRTVIAEPVQTPPEPEPSADSAQPPTKQRKPRAGSPKPVSLAELDRRAQALWGKGEVGAAKALLEEIVRRGGKSKYAELAFGDLFTMAHRDRGSQGQSRLWRRYLARFPRGKYADDARASLCRAASGADCWDAYLRDWPRGAHRSEAKRGASADSP